MKLLLLILSAFTSFSQGIVNPYAFASTFNPDVEPSIILHASGDNITGSDGDIVGLSDWGAPNNGARWIPFVGTELWNSLWSFSTEPVLKKGSNGINGKNVVRFNGVDSQNNMVSSNTFGGTQLMGFVTGVKKGSANNTGFLTINDGSSDDFDSVAEISFDEGTGANRIASTRNSVLLAQAIHPGVGVPFVFCTQFDGTNNINYLGDYPSIAVASTGTFASDRVGIGARHIGSGYSHNSQIDIADVQFFSSADNVLRKKALAKLNGTYGLVNPRVIVGNGDSIMQSGQWLDTDLAALWSTNHFAYIENLSIGGATITNGSGGNDLYTHAATADLYNRLASRANAEKTAVVIIEYVNEHNAGTSDQGLVNLTSNLCVLVRATGAKAIVATDWHTSTAGASTLMEAQWTLFADARIPFGTTNADELLSYSDGTHFNVPDGNRRSAEIARPTIESVFP